MAHESKSIASLPELHAYLESNHSNPPSLVTLKRWSAGKILAGAAVNQMSYQDSRSSGSEGDKRKARARVRYEISKAVEIISNIWDLGPPGAVGARQDPVGAPNPGQTAGGSDASLPQEVLSQIFAAIESLSRQIETNTKAVEEVSRNVSTQLGQLNAVRTSLMMKYDSTSAQQAQVVELLRQRLSDAGALETVAREVHGLKVSLSKVLDEIRSAKS